jgi:hypothetical protein
MGRAAWGKKSGTSGLLLVSNSNDFVLPSGEKSGLPICVEMPVQSLGIHSTHPADCRAGGS